MATFSDQKVNNVVGNNYTADSSAGFKSEVKHVFESYSAQGIDLSKNMGDVIASPSAKEDFIGNVTESLTTSPLFTSSACANSPFYNNYANRVEQLLENSLNTIATEAALIGYAPIVAYNPFFLKKRYLKTLDGTEYSLPECLYNDATVKTLMSESTGSPLKETGIDVSLCKNLELINSTYIDDAAIVKNDPAVELTPDIHIWKVDVSDGATPTAHTASVNVNIKTDITTHNFIKGKIHYVI